MPENDAMADGAAGSTDNNGTGSATPGTVAAQASTAQHGGFGALLRDAREARQLSIGQVAEELCLEPRYLVALEEERFEVVGPPVFAKGYLKSYCECLGLNQSELLRRYEEMTGGQPPPLIGRHSIQESAERRGSKGLWTGVVVAVIVIVALLALWYFRGGMVAG